MNISEHQRKEKQEYEDLVEPWRCTEAYTDDDCENCGRHRVFLCKNGKERCEKCNWVQGEDKYAPNEVYGMM